MNNTIDIIKALANKIKDNNGRCFFVGGCVRDKLLGKECFDYDIEVHNIPKEKLEEILNSFGNILILGKSFSVYNISGYNIDIALPRREFKTGVFHNNFKIEIDPYIGYEKAASRRDFTINGIMEDVLTGEVFDYFNGINDLNNKIIRHINDIKFVEDPLRVLRSAQFASRFSFTIALETINLCKKIDIRYLSKERIFNELEKALLKSPKPSMFFIYLKKMNHLDYWFKELTFPNNTLTKKLLFNKTMRFIDEACKYLDKIDNKIGFMISCLLFYTDNNYKEQISRLTNNNHLHKYIINMLNKKNDIIKALKHKSNFNNLNYLFYNSINTNDLSYLFLTYYDIVYKNNNLNVEKNIFEKLNDYNKIYNELIKGKDLIKIGIKPNKCFNDLILYGHKLQLEGKSKEFVLEEILQKTKG